MKKFLSPKNDFVFKKLFTSDTEILTDLINNALELTGSDRIISVEVNNPDILPDELERKFIILDIRAVDGSGHEYDIEMQVRRFEHYPRRSLFYLCRMYGDQLKSGEDYSELHPVIGIHFLDYTLFPDAPDFHYRFHLRDTRYPHLILTDDLSLHIFELPRIEQHMQALGSREPVDLLGWLHFFNHAQEGGEKNMKDHYKNPMIHRALDALQALSADEKTRELAERREKALKDEAMFLNEAKKIGREEGRKEGLKEGRKEGKKETAINLLKLGVLPIDQIAEATGLSVREIENVKSSLSDSSEPS